MALNDFVKDDLESQGCEVVERVLDRTYVCRCDPEDLLDIQARPYVIFSAPYDNTLVPVLANTLMPEPVMEPLSAGVRTNFQLEMPYRRSIEAAV